MKNYWLISADKKEIPGLGELLLNHPNTLYYPCGIGLLESCVNFTSFLSLPLKTPDGVILAGTAGSADESHLFKVNFSNSFTYPSFKSEVVPDFLYQRWKTESFISDEYRSRYLNFPVYSTFGLSTTTENNGDGMNDAWENMESLSISFICKKKSIPFMTLLCCTNKIGPDARTEWKDNYFKAGQVLYSELDFILGLPGLEH
jgi:hypothetical protein